MNGPIRANRGEEIRIFSFQNLATFTIKAFGVTSH
jgi:hypothetical protein